MSKDSGSSVRSSTVSSTEANGLSWDKESGEGAGGDDEIHLSSVMLWKKN